MEKVYIRYLYLPDFNDQESIRGMLNNLGFYVLHAPNGLDVYAIKKSIGLIEWFQNLFKGR